MENKIQDPILGELIWEEKHRWWKGKVRINSDLPFKIYLMDYPQDASEDLEPYRRFFEIICRNEAAAREFAAEELLETYNDYGWGDDDEILTKEEFCHRMKPESIGISDDAGEADYYYGGDLFGEHTIIVAINASGIFTYASFEG